MLDQLQAGGGAKDRLDYLSGRILVEKHDWLKASERLEKASEAVGAVNPALASQIDLMLGDCYGRLGTPIEQLTVHPPGKEHGSEQRADPGPAVGGDPAGGNYIDEALDLFARLIKQRAVQPAGDDRLRGPAPPEDAAAGSHPLPLGAGRTGAGRGGKGPAGQSADPALAGPGAGRPGPL